MNPSGMHFTAILGTQPAQSLRHVRPKGESVVTAFCVDALIEKRTKIATLAEGAIERYLGLYTFPRNQPPVSSTRLSLSWQTLSTGTSHPWVSHSLGTLPGG